MATYHSPRDAQHQKIPVESAEEALKSQRESDDSRTTVKKSIEDKDTRATLRPELDPRMPRGVRASHPGPDPNDPAVNRRVHCDPASAVNCPGLAILTKEMAEFVQPAVNRMLPENRVDRYQKEIDYEGVAFVLEGKAKELYVINPGGDQRMAYKGFKPSPEEPAEVSALAREGVFLRAPGSFQMPIDWYLSLIKWGDTCTEAAVRRAAWYPESYVGLLSSGRALALRVIALPPEADLTWLNGTRLADGCKPFDLVAKEMLERGHTGVSEGLKAAFFHSVNVKKSYWVGTDEKYHWSDPTPEKKSRKAPVEESPQPQPVVSKRDEDCKTGLMLLHASEPSGLATDAQDKSAGRGRRRIWEEEGKRVGRQTHQQSWKSKEKGQPSSPGSSLATPIKLEEGVKDRGKWYNPTHLDKRSYQPVFFQPYLFGSFHEALWYCYEEVVLASLFTRKTQGRTPYTRIFDRLAMAARSNQRGRTSDLARLNGVVRQLACGMIVGAGDVLRENPVGQTVVPHNGVLTMLTLYVIWWHENKHHPPPLGDQFDFSGLAQAVKRRTRPPEPPEPPAPWPQPPWRSGNVERMYPNSEVWDGDKGSTANDLWRVPRRCPQAQGKKQPLLPKPGIKWAMPPVQRPCPGRNQSVIGVAAEFGDKYANSCGFRKRARTYAEAIMTYHSDQEAEGEAEESRGLMTHLPVAIKPLARRATEQQSTLQVAAVEIVVAATSAVMALSSVAVVSHVARLARAYLVPTAIPSTSTLEENVGVSRHEAAWICLLFDKAPDIALRYHCLALRELQP